METTTPVDIEAGGDGVERAVVMGSVGAAGSSIGGGEEGRAMRGAWIVGVGASEGAGEGDALGGLLGVELGVLDAAIWALRLFAAWNRLSC